MNGAFYIGAVGLDSQTRALEVVANNIANVNTNGFKRSRAQFSELTGARAERVDETRDDAASPPAFWGAGMQVSAPDFTEGPLTQTGQPLDFAISGPGFVELMGSGGQIQLWRGGTLQINADGFLSGPGGAPLKAMISVPAGASSLTISADGTVSAVLSGSTSATNIGQIDVVQDKDLTSITVQPGGVYLPANINDLTNATPGEDGAGSLVQGSLETSNVDLSTEMVTLMLMQRAYAANAQVVQAGDQLMSIANNLRR